MIWKLSKQEIIAILAYTINPNSWFGERAIKQQRNVAFNPKTGEIFATDGQSLLMIGSGLLPKGEDKDLVIVPPEALEYHKSRAKKPTNECAIEIVGQKITITSMGQTETFEPFDGGYSPVHDIFKILDLCEETPVRGFPLDQLEKLGKIARATGSMHGNFAGGKDECDPVVFSVRTLKTKQREARNWVVLVMPTKGCESLARTLLSEKQQS